MAELYLMRHGQTRFNLQGRIQGACDSPLTEEGQAQARQARKYFQEQDISFSQVYASTQERACDTAELVSGRTDYQRLKGIKEWDFGWFEGEREILQPKLTGPSYGDFFVQFGGEDSQAVGQRMTETLTQLMIKHKDDADPILAVSHGGAMWAFLLSLDLPDLPKLGLPNCSIFHYRYEQGQFDLQAVIDPVANHIIYQKEGDLR
ncbi:histidine phosphatase family protein [Streptococcus cuniculipharyngis]|uniref:Histidine phosphatase family protein n=1 Tax=Streptococcus cuniculipharyngis TaxID=1562651 RepID=A0A5C5SDU5_9STRE|nr:histidine phosphatase family protein [Streptococcus cuniculipharyngis]TWS98929.1 histidine phosphatase family protein [Streptococcus cuniculipharyngis]